MLKLGDIVIHPEYVVCKIKNIQKEKEGDMFILKPRKPLPGDFKILIPNDKKRLKKAGVRYPIMKGEITYILKMLSDDPKDLLEDREKGYFVTKEKARSGNPYKMAEVVRDLKGQNTRYLSGREVQLRNNLLESTKDKLVEEIAYVKNMSKGEVNKILDDSLK